METLDQIIALIALSMGTAWASGLNLYATLLVLGLGANTGNVELPPGLEVVADPMVIMAAGFMYCVEFFADKVPGVDTGWDSLHTFVRIPAGALLAAGAVADIGLAAELSAAIVGAGVATATHATKAGTRVLINTSPEPVTNWTASFAEDFAAIGGVMLALNNPGWFLLALVLFLLLLIWLLPKLWRGTRKVFRFLFGRPSAPDVSPVAQPRLPDKDQAQDSK